MSENFFLKSFLALARLSLSLLATLVLLVGSLAHSQILEVVLQDGQPVKGQIKEWITDVLHPGKAVNLYEVNPSQVRALPLVSRMKYFENQKRWKECADVA
ncbi:MAG: hypothetical protein JNM39_16150, partial [Bdellovibrionaceae bacterium]|nr:hypothetical protein [Pseudobdellovibrionaceae bacterium]